MKISARKLENILQGRWPILAWTPNVPTNVVISDEHYWCPSYREVKNLMRDTYFNKYRWAKNLFDCDDFARLLHAWVIQQRYQAMTEKRLKSSERFNWAFGQVWFSGHAVNFCITNESEMLIIKPQTEKVRRVCEEDFARLVIV